MKIIILSLLVTHTALAETQEQTQKEKTLSLKAHVQSMMLEKSGTYRLELREYAAAYYAADKFIPCLQKSMKDKKMASLEVAAFSLNVLDCKNE